MQAATAMLNSFFAEIIDHLKRVRVLPRGADHSAVIRVMMRSRHCELMKETELFLREFSATVTDGCKAAVYPPKGVITDGGSIQIKTHFSPQRLMVKQPSQLKHEQSVCRVTFLKLTILPTAVKPPGNHFPEVRLSLSANGWRSEERERADVRLVFHIHFSAFEFPVLLGPDTERGDHPAALNLVVVRAVQGFVLVRVEHFVRL